MRILFCVFFALLAGHASSRTPLSPEAVHFFVSMSGSDANDCRVATPCLTIQRAVDNIKQNFDSNCLQAWINVAPGTYAGWEDYGPQVGCHRKGGGPLVISGSVVPGAGETCADTMGVQIVSPPGVNAISLDGGAIQTIICMTVSASGASAVYATNGAIAEIGVMGFGTANQHIMADAGGSVFVTSTINVVQGAHVGIWANLGGLVYVVPGVSINFAPGTGFTHYIFASNGGKVVLPIGSITITGSPTGQKCFASLLGIVNAAGNAAGIPGQGACGSNYGGQVY